MELLPIPGRDADFDPFLPGRGEPGASGRGEEQGQGQGEARPAPVFPIPPLHRRPFRQ